MTMFLQTLVTGLLLGGVLALLSSGLTLIFGVMRVVNFAHGEFVMLGMYATVFLTDITGITHPQLFAPVLLAGFTLLGAAVYGLTLRHVSGTKRHDAQLIMTLGISLVLQNFTLMLFGSKSYLLGTAMGGAWSFNDILFNKPRTIGFAVAAGAVALLVAFLNSTRAGRMVRATADDPEAATYIGIDVRRINMLTFAIGIGLAGLGGGILASFYPTHPYVGADFIVLMFVAVVLGGLGSISGALFGGIAVGMTQAFTPLFLPLDLQNVIVFVIFLLVLFLRPHGIFGKPARV